MGDSHDGSDACPDDDDDTDWVRLHTLSPALYSTYLRELQARLEAGDATPADLARFVERCLSSARCVDHLDARLPGLGLTFGQFIDLRNEAIAAEQAATERVDAELAEDRTKASEERRARRHPIKAGPQSKEMTTLIMNLSLRGLEDERIACVLPIHHTWPTIVRRRMRLHAGARAVVRAHLEGKSLGEIQRATGVPPTSALRILRQIGESPNGAKARVDARARANTIVKLRAKGLAYKEIAERVDCSMDVVKNVLRPERRHRYGGGGGRVSE